MRQLAPSPVDARIVRPRPRAGNRPLRLAGACPNLERLLPVRTPVIVEHEPARAWRRVRLGAVLILSLAFHVGLVAAFGRMKVRYQAADFLPFGPMAVQILPADAPADGEPGDTGPIANGAPEPTEPVAPPIVTMNWTPPPMPQFDVPTPPKPEAPLVFGPGESLAMPTPGEVIGIEIAGTAGVADARPDGTGQTVAAGELARLPTAVSAGTGNGTGRARYLRNPQPVYPRIARENGWEGTTVLRVEVRPDGLPGNIEILQTSGHRVLDEVCVETVRRWKFVPAKLEDRPVVAWVEVPISFKLMNG